MDNLRNAEEEKIHAKHLMGKTVVTKSGKKFGEVGNITFESRTGELMQIKLKNPTSYIDQLDIDQDKSGIWCVPYSAVIAVGDFVVVSEEDIV